MSQRINYIIISDFGRDPKEYFVCSGSSLKDLKVGDRITTHINYDDDDDYSEYKEFNDTSLSPKVTKVVKTDNSMMYKLEQTDSYLEIVFDENGLPVVVGLKDGNCYPVVRHR